MEARIALFRAAVATALSWLGSEYTCIFSVLVGLAAASLRVALPPKFGLSVFP